MSVTYTRKDDFTLHIREQDKLIVAFIMLKGEALVVAAIAKAACDHDKALFEQFKELAKKSLQTLIETFSPDTKIKAWVERPAGTKDQ